MVPMSPSYMTDYDAYSPDMGGDGGGVYENGFSNVAPYFQLAMKLYGTLSGENTSDEIEKKARAAAAQAGVSDFNEVNAPSELDKTRKAEHEVGQFALNFVPYVGTALSALATTHNQAKATSAAQDYMKKILEANPAMSASGGVNLQPEMVKQSNYAAQFAGARPEYEQNILEKNLFPATEKFYNKMGFAGKFAKKTDALYRLVGGVKDAKARQQERLTAIHKKNVSKLRDAAAASQVPRFGALAQAYKDDPNLQYLFQMLAARKSRT